MKFAKNNNFFLSYLMFLMYFFEIEFCVILQSIKKESSPIIKKSFIKRIFIFKKDH